MAWQASSHALGLTPSIGRATSTAARKVTPVTYSPALGQIRNIGASIQHYSQRQLSLRQTPQVVGFRSRAARFIFFSISHVQIQILSLVLNSVCGVQNGTHWHPDFVFL
jgi:hypothetical protein